MRTQRTGRGRSLSGHYRRDVVSSSKPGSVVRHVFACGMSRSGTTLLTTILDSHPEISMGYELLAPRGLGTIDEARAHLREAAAATRPATAVLLESPATEPLGRLLVNCNQVGAGHRAVDRALAALGGDGHRRLDDLATKVQLALALVDRKRSREGTRVSGFKLNTSKAAIVHDMLPDSAFVYIVRDPRDMAASQLRRGFERSVAHMATAWNRYLRRYRRLCDDHPERAAIVRYEDLVRQPDTELDRIFGTVGVEAHPDARRFFESKATIHGSRHNNAPRVGQDLSSSSIGRWRSDLSAWQARSIRSICGKGMRSLGYGKDVV